jgi:hypothetical protein
LLDEGSISHFSTLGMPRASSHPTLLDMGLP